MVETQKRIDERTQSANHIKMIGQSSTPTTPSSDNTEQTDPFNIVWPIKPEE